jgi:DNA-binding Lrp family transcriptional regulator
MAKYKATELKLFALAQMYGDNPAANLGKMTGIKEHTVRRTLRAAFDNETLVRRVFVNLFDLGLQQYAVFISAKISSGAARTKIRQALLAAPWIELILELTGEYDFALVVTAESVLDLEALLDSISKKTSIPLSRIQIQARTAWHYFGSKHLNPSNPLEPINIVPTGRHLHLSHEEALVLEAFATERQSNIAKMARGLGIPSTTFDYQLERLKTSGVILGVRYQFTPTSIGYSAYRVFIVLGSYSLEIRQQLKAWGEKNPYVISLMYGVGPWHCELRLEAPDALIAKEVIDDLRYHFFSVIESVSLLPVLRVLKMKLHPDLSLFTRLEEGLRNSVNLRK